MVCRTPGGISLLAVEREHLTTGFTVEEVYDLAGLRGCLTTRVRFHDVRVPAGNLIGREGQGAELTQKRGGAVPILQHQAVADVLTDAKGKIEATRLLTWRAMDAVLSQDPAGLELALHAKVFGSETAVEVVTSLVKVVGVQAYDLGFPLMDHLADALAYPVIEGSNVGVRRRQLQALMLSNGWDPLHASGLAR